MTTSSASSYMNVIEQKVVFIFINLAQFAPKVDSTIVRISHHPGERITLIHWITIYTVDSVIPLTNWD